MPAISYSPFVSFDIKVSNSRITISIDDGTAKRRGKRIFKREVCGGSIQDEITKCLEKCSEEIQLRDYKITFTKFGKSYVGVIHS